MTEKKELDPVADAMMKAMFIIVMIAALAPTLQRMFSVSSAQALQAQSYVGLTDSRTLRATASLQWLNLVSDPPYHPWITASFHNDGPHSVFIAINSPGEPTEIASGGGIEVDMSGGDRRIEFVFYRCNAGETASVVVVGKY